MKQISYWAGKNIIFTRWLLVFLNIAFAILSIILGVGLYANGIYIPIWSINLIIGLSMIPLFLYPQNRRFSTVVAKDSYYKKRFRYALFILGFTVALFASFGNQRIHHILLSEESAEFKTLKTSEVTLVNDATAKETRRSVKKAIKNQYKKLFKYFKDKKVGMEKPAQLAWIGIGLIALGFLIAVLGCALLCEGGFLAGLLTVLIFASWGGGLGFLIAAIVTAVKSNKSGSG